MNLLTMQLFNNTVLPPLAIYDHSSLWSKDSTSYNYNSSAMTTLVKHESPAAMIFNVLVHAVMLVQGHAQMVTDGVTLSLSSA